MNMTKTCVCNDPHAHYCTMHGIFLSVADAALAASKSEAADAQLAKEIFAAEKPAPKPVPQGRIIDGGRVHLRPYNGPQLGETPAAPVQPAPLQLLLSAATLIDNQPTPEQWKTLKEAIRAIVPSPTGV